MYVKPRDYLTFKGSNEGQKFIVYLLGLDVNLMKEIHKSIKSVIAGEMRWISSTIFKCISFYNPRTKITLTFEVGIQMIHIVHAI